MKICWLLLHSLLILSLVTTTLAQKRTESFEQIDLLLPDNKTVSARVIFTNDMVRVVDKKNGTTLKVFRYTDLTTAEYTYTHSYRWREGLTMTAVGFVIPPLWLVALPMGFSKTKHHWITIQSGNDYAVLKVNKRIRKLFIPSFEVHTGLRIEPMGDSK